MFEEVVANFVPTDSDDWLGANLYISSALN
jgi:hypothetical protein